MTIEIEYTTNAHSIIYEKVEKQSWKKEFLGEHFNVFFADSSSTKDY